MKLVFFFLVAVAYSVVVCAERDDRALIKNKRQEVYKQIFKFNNLIKIQQCNWTLHTPPLEVDNCCSLSALRCFTEELQKLSHKLSHKLSEKPNKIMMLLIKNLRNPLTENGVNSCSPEEIKDTACAPCHSHPKKDTKDFMEQLKSLFNKANSK